METSVDSKVMRSTESLTMCLKTLESQVDKQGRLNMTSCHSCRGLAECLRPACLTNTGATCDISREGWFGPSEAHAKPTPFTGIVILAFGRSAQTDPPTSPLSIFEDGLLKASPQGPSCNLSKLAAMIWIGCFGRNLGSQASTFPIVFRQADLVHTTELGIWSNQAPTSEFNAWCFGMLGPQICRGTASPAINRPAVRLVTKSCCVSTNLLFKKIGFCFPEELLYLCTVVHHRMMMSNRN